MPLFFVSLFPADLIGFPTARRAAVPVGAGDQPVSVNGFGPQAQKGLGAAVEQAIDLN